jgi:hypothetical protein
MGVIFLLPFPATGMYWDWCFRSAAISSLIQAKQINQNPTLRSKNYSFLVFFLFLGFLFPSQLVLGSRVISFLVFKKIIGFLFPSQLFLRFRKFFQSFTASGRRKMAHYIQYNSIQLKNKKKNKKRELRCHLQIAKLVCQLHQHIVIP